MLKLSTFVLALLAPISIQAQTAPEPLLETAVEAWLNGNEEASLPALSALAQDGNETAAIFFSAY